MKIRRLQAWIAEQFFGRPLKIAAGAAIACAVGVAEASAQTWSAATDGNWSATTSWSGGVAPVSGNGTALTFGGSTAYTATNDLGDFTLNKITVSNSAATTIVGGTGLTFAGTSPAITINSGSGATTISGPITYSVATVLTNNSSSLLTLSDTQAFNTNATFSGTGAITISGVSTVNAARTFTNDSSGLLTIGAIDPTTYGLTFSGNGNTTVNGVISGTAGTAITKNGTGKLKLSGANTFTGNITVNAGTLELGNTGTAGASGNTITLANGTTVHTTAGYTTTSTKHIFSVAANATVTFDVPSTGNMSLLGNHLIGTTGTINKIGAGQLNVGSSGTATIRTLNIQEGVLRVTSNRLASVNAINISSGAQFLISDDGALNLPLTGSYSFSGNGPSNNGALRLDATGSGTVVTTIPSPVTLSGDTMVNVQPATSATANIVLSGNVSGAGGIIKIGTGSLTLRGTNNTFAGDIFVRNGSLAIAGGADRLPTTSSLILGDSAANTSGSFDLNDQSQTVAGLTALGTGTNNNVLNSGTSTPTLTVNRASGTQTFAGQLSGNINFAKSGAGDYTLSGTNSYSGSTTINAGTLVIGSAASLPATSNNIIVTSGAVLDLSTLSGGYNFGSSQVLTVGRTTASANDIVGSLGTSGAFNVGGTGIAAVATISGDAGFNSSTLLFDLSNTPANTHDIIAVGGNLSFSGTNALTINQLNGPLSNGNYTLFTYSGSLIGDFNNLSVSGVGGGRQTAAIDTASTPGSVLLAVTGNAANLIWVGNGNSNVWDLETTSNFTGATNNDNRFYNGDVVTFNASGVGGATPVLVTGTLNPASVTFAGTQDYTFSDGGGGGITGNGAITMNGTGSVSLGVPVTSIATTTVNSGTMSIVSGGSIAGAVTVTGGTLNGTVFNSVGGPLTLTGGNVYGSTDGAFNGNVSITGGVFYVTNATGSAINNSSSISVSDSGVLQIGDGGTAGAITGTVALSSGGTLAFNRTDDTFINNAITGSGNLANLGTGSVTVGTGFTSGSINFSGSGNLLLNGTISGSTTITQSGTGTTTLAPSVGNNTQTGAINITRGTLIVGVGGVGNAAAVVTVNGGTYYSWIGQTNTQPFNIGANGGTIKVDPDFVFVKSTNGIIGAGNTLTITGGGTVALQGSGTTTVSNVIVDNGIYRHTSVRYATAVTTPYTIDVKPGSTLMNFDTDSFDGTNYFPYGNLTGTGAAGSKITFSGDGAIGGGGVDSTTMFGAYLHALGEASTTASNTNTSSIKVPVVLASDSRFTLAVGVNGTRSSTDRIVDNLLGGVSGPGGLIVDGDGNGTLVINTVPATYAGQTRVANGTLRIGMNDALPTGTTLSLGGTTGDNVADSSGTFELNGKSQTVAGLATVGNGNFNRIGNAPTTAGALTVNYNGASPQAFSGAIGYTDQNSVSFRNLAFTKDGTGTLILSGTNDYTLATTINAGTLKIATASALPSNTAEVIVASGATLDVSDVAGGYSFISGRTLTLGRTTAPANDLIGSAAIAGTLNIGGSNTVATATISGDLTLNAATLNFDLSNSLANGNDLLNIAGNLNATGVTTIMVNQTGGSLAQGSYTLFNYSGALSGDATNFGLSGIASVGARATYQLDTTTTAGSVLLNVSGSPATLTWVGNSGNNAWDLMSTANFTGAAGAVPDNRFYNGDTVTFNATGVGTAIPVTIDNALMPASVVVSGAQDYTFSGTGSVAAGTFTKDGTAALLLNVPVTATSTTINAGTFTIGNGGSVSGPIDVIGGMLNANVPGALTDAVTISGGTLNITATQNITGATTVSSGTLNITASSTLTGGLAVSGGMVTLAAANTIDTVTLSGGTTQLGATDALGSTGSVNLSGGALLQATASQELNRNIIVGTGGATVNVSGTDIFQWNGTTEGSSTTTLIKTGSGTLAMTGLNGANGGFTGTVDIQAGTVILSGRPGNAGDGNLNATSIMVHNGGKFQFGAFPLLSGDNPDLPEATFITVESGGVVNWQVSENFGGVHLQGGALNLLNGGVNLSGTSNWTSGTITGVLSSGIPAYNVGGTTLTTSPTSTIAIQKTTPGTVTVTDANITVSGIINVAEGTLSTNAGITNTTNPLTLGGTTTSGTLQLRHTAAATFAKPVILNAGSGTIDVQNAAGNITWSAAVSGAGNLTKTGSGILNLTGTNTYTGTTTVSAGKLLINGNSSAATGNVNVRPAAAIGGSGTVGGLTTLAGTASVAPGNSAGNLTFAAGADLSAGGIYQWELGALSTSSGFDTMTVSGGNLTLGGSSALTLDFGLITAIDPNSSDAFWNTAQTWKIIDVTDSATNVGNASLSTITNATYTRGTFSTAVGTAADAGDIFLVFTPSVSGPPTWQGANNDNWTAAGSWTGAVPNSATAEAKFVSSGGTTANLIADQTVNKLTFDATIDHTISGTGKLTLAGTTPTISTTAGTSGTQKVETNLDLAAGTTVAVNGGTLELNTPVDATLGTGVAATVANGATLKLGGTGNALSNGTTTHANVANDGTLAATTAGKRVGNITGTGTTTVTTAGASLTANKIEQATLNIGTGNTVSIAANGTSTSVISSALNIPATPNTPDTDPFTPLNSYGGTLDLADNNLLLRGATGQGSALVASARDMVLAGFNPLNGFWDGTGLKSSAAAANPLGNTALAVVLNSDAGFPIFATGSDIGAATGNTEFAGIGALTADDVIIRYTYFGDANLDGVVDGDDQSLLDTGFAGGGSGWFFGDFNYDGVTNGDDQSLLDASFGQPALLGGSSFSLMGASSFSFSAGGASQGVAAVPEPSTWAAGGALLLGLAGFRLRRQRHKKE